MKKKISKYIIFCILISMILMPIFSVSAANSKLKDVGVKIKDSDLVALNFNHTQRTQRRYLKYLDDQRKANPALPITDDMVYPELNMCTFDANINDTAHLDELGCYALKRPGDQEIIQIFFKDAITIDNKKIDVNFEFQLIEGASVPDEYYEQYAKDAFNRIGLWNDGRATLFNHGGKVRVKIMFVYNNQPYKFTGAFGFKDPDHGDLMFNTTNRTLYYTDANASSFEAGWDNDTITNQQLASTTYASHTEVTSGGIIHPLENSSRIGGKETVGYNNAIVAINLLEESEFEFYLTSYWNDGDWTMYPFLYNKITVNEVAKAQVVFKDQSDNNKVLRKRNVVEGTLGSPIVDGGYTTDLNNYLNDGYELVSNGMTNAVFNNSTGEVQEVPIILKHKTTQTTESKTVTRTINYYKNNTSGGKLFDSKVQSQVFERTKTVDQVTGATTYSSWTPASKDFPAVNNPTHDEWYTDDANVPKLTVTQASSNTTVNIIYKQYQYATVVYVDETDNNKTLETSARMKGKQGANIDYNATDRINFYKDRGYTLVSNEIATTQKFDSNSSKDQEFLVVLKHTYTTVNKDTYEIDKCLNNACTAKQPEKGC